MSDPAADGLPNGLAAFAAGDLWRFSLDFYARPGIAPACLRLQDHHGLDVNLVLFCLWAGQRGRRLGAEELAAIAAEARLWQRQAVAPLRQARRWLKAQESAGDPKVATLRAAIKEQELRAEAIEQERLARHLPGRGGTADEAAARDNLEAYLHGEAVDKTDDVKFILDSLLSELFNVNS